MYACVGVCMCAVEGDEAVLVHTQPAPVGKPVEHLSSSTNKVITAIADHPDSDVAPAGSNMDQAAAAAAVTTAAAGKQQQRSSSTVSSGVLDTVPSQGRDQLAGTSSQAGQVQCAGPTLDDVRHLMASSMERPYTGEVGCV